MMPASQQMLISGRHDGACLLLLLAASLTLVIKRSFPWSLTLDFEQCTSGIVKNLPAAVYSRRFAS